MKTVFARLGVTGSTSTAYHPQTDGQTERVNQEMEQYLRAFTDVRQENWSALLPMAEFAHNTRAHSATRSSPFALLYGYDPEFMIAPSEHLSTVPAADERLEGLRRAQDDAKAALEVAAERMKTFYDRRRLEAPEFAEGDLVWLDARNVNLPGTRKLTACRLGAFPVKRQIGLMNYELDLPASLRIHPVFHISLLSKHAPDTIEGRVQVPPEAIEVDGDVEYEVEDILNSRLNRGHLEFLVRWKGYSPAHDSWEPEANVVHAPALIRAFYRKYPLAARSAL